MTAYDWPAEVTAGTGHLVLGVTCRDSHFNDPRVAYCSNCGVAMAQATRLPVWGPRPQLGVLVVDDGSMFALTMDHVLGRAPETDPEVAAGVASPLWLDDELVASVHARLVLAGWDVRLVDAGSPTGTFVCGRDERRWTALARGGEVVLRPGDLIAVGPRQLRYHSHRTV